MASAYHRLLDLTAFTMNSNNPRQLLTMAWDAGKYSTVVIHIRVPRGAANAGARVFVEHAAVLEEDAFIPLQVGGQDVSVNLDNSYSMVFAVPAFLRFLRWRVDGLTSGDALVLIDGVAKD